MAFLSKLFGGKKVDKAALFKNITRGVDPASVWEIIDALGEGTFGVVHKVRWMEVSAVAFTKGRSKTSRPTRSLLQR
jgi:hypothetical protein